MPSHIMNVDLDVWYLMVSLDYNDFKQTKDVHHITFISMNLNNPNITGSIY